MQNQSPQNPESLAVIARVQEIIDNGKASTTKEVENLLGNFRTEMIGALNQVTSGFKAPVGTEKTPEVPTAVHEAVLQAAAQDKEGMQKVVERRIFGALGMPTWNPTPVSFTKEQALASIATGQPTMEVLSVAERGLSAIGVEAAFEHNIVQAPKKGMSKMQIAALAIGAVGAVAGGMYFAKAGPFKPESTES